MNEEKGESWRSPDVVYSVHAPHTTPIGGGILPLTYQLPLDTKEEKGDELVPTPDQWVAVM